MIFDRPFYFMHSAVGTLVSPFLLDFVLYSLILQLISLYSSRN